MRAHWQITLTCPEAAVEAAIAVLSPHCPGGLIIEEPWVLRRQLETGAWDLTDLTPPQGDTASVRGFVDGAQRRPIAAAARRAAALLGQDWGCSWQLVPAADWEEAVKRTFTPQRFGRLIVSPAWGRPDAGAGDAVLTLDPGLAFGTGDHATTRMCLTELVRRVGPGSRVLDWGTGSGILAIAAALMGAGEVLALDTDPQALKVAESNWERNGRPGRVAFALVDRPPAGWGAELLLANITTPVLAAGMPALRAALAPGGVAALSGLSTAGEADVAGAAAAAGLRLESRELTGDWVCLVYSAGGGTTGA